MWMEGVAATVKALFLNLSLGTEEGHEKHECLRTLSRDANSWYHEYEVGLDLPTTYPQYSELMLTELMFVRLS
jgi:hypothetical protein